MYIKLVIISIVCGLMGCQSLSFEAQQPPKLFDEAFPNYIEQTIESANEVFALDSELKHFVDTNTEKGRSQTAKLNNLVEAIFNRNKLSLSYQASANTRATDTFKNRAANCLSLTIMTYSMAQHLGLKSQFQDVLIPEFWTRRNGSTLINRHVNLIVTPQEMSGTILLSRRQLTIDFDPQQNIQSFKVRKLSKSQILSYFYSNKAADFQLTKQPSRAFAYLKAAILADSSNESAWLNLGVLLAQHGHYMQAKSYYEYALLLKPNYTTARENLAILYNRQGNVDKANREFKKIHKKRLKNPFYHIMLGDVAFDETTYKKAIKHYKTAITLDNRRHEFYFKLAKVYYESGDMKNTRRYLETAKRKTKNLQQEQRYASKMSALIATY